MARAVSSSIALAAVAVAGCNQVFGLDRIDSDAAATAIDAGVIDADATTCVATVGGTPAPARRLNLGVQWAVGGATQVASTRFAVATSITAEPALKDGFIIRTNDADVDVYRIDGSGNDQLWTIAGGATQALAVGITRSYRSINEDGDDGLLVWLGVGRSELPLTAVLDETPDRGIKLTAVAADGQGWRVAGDHGDGGLVAAISADREVSNATLITGWAGLLVRKVVVAGALTVVIGNGTPGGVVIAIDLLGTTSPWNQGFANVNLFDAALIDDRVVVVGRSGDDGVVFELGLDGTLLEAYRLPGRRLHRVTLAGARRWYGGVDRSNRVWVGTSDGTCVTGADHPDLTEARPIALPLPLVAAADGATLYGGSAGALRELPLSIAGTSTCAPSSSWVEELEPLTIPPLVGALTISALAVSLMDVAPTVTRPVASPQPGC